MKLSAANRGGSSVLKEQYCSSFACLPRSKRRCLRPLPNSPVLENNSYKLLIDYPYHIKAYSALKSVIDALHLFARKLYYAEDVDRARCCEGGVRRNESGLSFCSTGKRGKLLMEDMSDILLVEDNKYNVEFILEALNKHNLAHRVKVFRDGGEALKYLFAAGEYRDRCSFQQPRLILLDLGLPKVDGLELLRMIRTNETTKMIPVVVFSSSTSDQDRIDSYRLGANSFIIKPIGYDRFVETVSEIGSYWALQNAPP